MAGSTIEECDRLLDMINTMLVISRTEAGVSSLAKKEIDISAVLRDACDLFQSAADLPDENWDLLSHSMSRNANR